MIIIKAKLNWYKHMEIIYSIYIQQNLELCLANKTTHSSRNVHVSTKISTSAVLMVLKQARWFRQRQLNFIVCRGL